MLIDTDFGSKTERYRIQRFNRKNIHVLPFLWHKWIILFFFVDFWNSDVHGHLLSIQFGYDWVLDRNALISIAFRHYDHFCSVKDRAFSIEKYISMPFESTIIVQVPFFFQPTEYIGFKPPRHEQKTIRRHFLDSFRCFCKNRHDSPSKWLSQASFHSNNGNGKGIVFYPWFYLVLFCLQRLYGIQKSCTWASCVSCYTICILYLLLSSFTCPFKWLFFLDCSFLSCLFWLYVYIYIYFQLLIVLNNRKKYTTSTRRINKNLYTPSVFERNLLFIQLMDFLYEGIFISNNNK